MREVLTHSWESRNAQVRPSLMREVHGAGLLTHTMTKAKHPVPPGVLESTMCWEDGIHEHLEQSDPGELVGQTSHSHCATLL